MTDRILIIKLGALGDMVQAASAFSALRQYHKKAHLTLLTTAAYQEMAKKMGYFDEVWLDEKAKLYQVSKLLNFRNKLGHAGFSRIYDLQNVDRTRLYGLLLSKKSKWIAPHKNDRFLHPQERFAKLFEPLGIPFSGVLDLKQIAESYTDSTIDFFQNLSLSSSEQVRGSGDSRNECENDNAGKVGFERTTLIPKPYVLLIPGASMAHGGRKKWPEECYAKVAAILLAKGIQPILIGGSGENWACIKNQVPGIIDLSGKTTFYQVIGLAQNALFTLGNDTGPTLLAASGGSPTLTLHASCNPPSLGGARGPKHQSLYEPDLNNLTVDTVMRKLDEFLLRGN